MNSISGGVAIEVLSYLPGRARIQLAQLHRVSLTKWKDLQSDLSSLSGIDTVKANPVSGRILIFFDPNSVYDSPEPLVSEINRILTGAVTRRVSENIPNVSWLGTLKGQAFNVVAYGLIFLYSLGVRLFTEGRGGVGLTPVFLIKSGANIFSGYPWLRRMVEGLPRVGRCSGPLLLTMTTLVMLGITGGPLPLLTGLIVSISSFTHLGIEQKMMRRQTALGAGLNNGVQLETKETLAREWLNLPSDLPELENYARQISVIAFGTALVLVIMGKPVAGLAVLIVANPRSAYSSATVSLAAIFEKLDSRGILVNRYEAVPRLARIENIAFEAPGILTAKFPVITEIIVYKPGMTELQVASLIYSAVCETNLPLEKALDQYIVEKGIRTVHQFTGRAARGKGIICVTEDDELLVGSLGFLRNQQIPIRAARNDAAHFKLLQQEVYGLAINGELAGLIALGSGSSLEAGQTLEKLRRMGFYEPQVRKRQCPSFLPQEFGLRPIDDLEPGNRVMLVTEAFNPARHGEKAYISVVPGNADHRAMRQADLILPGSWVEHLSFLIDCGRTLREINRQNAILSGGTGMIGMMLVLTGQISILAAAVIGEWLNLAVTLNASRLSADDQNITGAEASILPIDEEIVVGVRPSTEYAVSCELNSSPFLGEMIHPRYWQHGLPDWEASQRLAQFGLNQLVQRTPAGWIRLFFGQFKDIAALTLIGAGGVAATMGHFVDTLTILAILILNAALGASQEFKAERSMEAMRRITAPRARVLRDGMMTIVAAAKLVPGDCLLLEAGDRVPADALIIAGHGITVEESMLTGESEPLIKQPLLTSCYLAGEEDAMAIEYLRPIWLQDNSQLDSPSMLFMGSNIVRGRCKAVVTATGMRTQMGRIMNMVEAGGEVAPIQSQYKDINKFLVCGSLAAAVLVSGIGIIAGRGTPLQMIMTGLSMAVAAIPEGLPTIVNIALSSGIQRMVKKGALVRRISAMETLGRVDYICTDKTGTITSNHLAIQGICLLDKSLSVDQIEAMAADNDVLWAMTIGMLCNDAAGDGQGGFSGDAVDVAFLDFGLKLGIHPEALKAKYRRIFSTPFESERRYMAIMNKDGKGNYYLMVKGAPEKVFRFCSSYHAGGQILPLDPAVLDKYIQGCDLMASDAYRVIAVAYRREADLPPDVTAESSHYFENDLVLAGLIGMLDPIRPGVVEAVSKCRQAGIKVVMITGDHPKTAGAIGKSAGILDDSGQILNGWEMDKLDDDHLAGLVDKIQVFARVKPVHKLRIVNMLRKAGHRVIMTGDGVNDAPAVKWADVGIAMGTGTEVTKEAATIILVNDGFATIERAIDESRTINRNVKSAMEFLVAGNSGEVALMALAVLFGVPLPLLPLHILLVNLFTDGLPALGLALREPSPDRDNGKQFGVRRFEEDPHFYSRVIIRGLLSGATSLSVYLYSLRAGMGINRARSIAFASIVSCQFLQLTHWPAIGIRRADWVQNDPGLRKVILLSWGGLLTSLYLPGLFNLFGLTPLSLRDWLTVLVPAVTSAGVATYSEEKLNCHLTQLNKANDYMKGGHQRCQVTEEVFSRG